MRCYFLVYEKNDKKGNALTNIDPYKWLIKHRGENSESELIVLRWLQVEVDQYAYEGLQAQIGIEYDEGKSKKVEEPVIVEKPKEVEPKAIPIPNEQIAPELEKRDHGRPKGWALRKEFVDSNGDVYYKGKLVPKPESK